MKHMLHIYTALLITVFCFSSSLQAQNYDDSIEDSWNRAARHKSQDATQQQNTERKQQDAYDWTKGQQQKQQIEKQSPPPATLSRMPANATAADYYYANNALIDTLTSMYCVSTTYLRTLRNRNEAANVAIPKEVAPPKEDPKPEGDRFKYEKDNWRKKQQTEKPAPAPNINLSALSTLNQELFQLLDKCLNR
jgi:hypothetical protein